jgi:hypothetical protein
MFDSELKLRDDSTALTANEQSIVSTVRSSGCAVIDLGETPVKGMSVVIVCPTAASGTSPTLDVKIQESDSAASGYKDLVTFDQITGAVTPCRRIRRFATTKRYIRHYATIGGSNTPDFKLTQILIGGEDWENIPGA